MNIAPGKRVAVLLKHGGDEERARLQANRMYVEALAHIDGIDWLEDDALVADCATTLLGDMKLYVPLSVLMDKAAETERLSRDIDKHRKDLARSRGKLENSNFVSRAPAEIVARERTRVADLHAAIIKLEEQLERLS